MKTNILTIAKKILICSLAFVLCLSCVGCNNKTPDNSSSNLPYTPNASGDSTFDGSAGNQSNNDTTSEDSSTTTSTPDFNQSKPSQQNNSSNNSSSSIPTPSNNSSSKPTASNNSSSKPTSSNNSSSSTPNTSSTPTPPPAPRLIVSCWGDSLTEGMRMTNGNDFPSLLNNMLGTDKYDVLNGGDGGEDTITIMARQGALKIFTSNQITFKAGDASVRIGDGKGNGFETADGEVIRLTAALGREMPINNITIGSQKYKLVLNNFNWSDRSCEVYLQRTSGFDSALTIEKGTEAKFASADLAKTNHCDIYLMGCNGGYGSNKNNYKALIAQHQQMIDYRGNDNYLVIIPYWTSNTFTKYFIEAFGDKAIDFRAAATDQSILEDTLHLNLTDLDKTQIASSQKIIPPCLRLNNSSTDVHLNETGYLLLAKLLHTRGQELGYW